MLDSECSERGIEAKGSRSDKSIYQAQPMREVETAKVSDGL